MISFPHEINAPSNPNGTFTATVRVQIPQGASPADVITYIRSMALKHDIMASWARVNAPNHGLEVHGGPRPVTADPKDLSSKLLAYEQDFRFCPRI